MKLLFLTIQNRIITSEHIFTRNVFETICERFEKDGNEIALSTIFQVEDSIDTYITEEMYADKIYYKLYYSTFLPEKDKIAEIARFFRYISPSIIHSNMTEAIDVAAAKLSNIPIVLTIHVGGLICPRGELHGFMKYNNEICSMAVGTHCLKCCAKDLPFSSLSYLLYKIIPDKLLTKAYHKFRKKQLFYVTQFLSSYNEVVRRKVYIDIFKYATIIVANNRLKKLLALNGLTDNVALLPHGVKERQHFPIPSLNGVVKFYYLGRIQYAKGLHILLQAFGGISNSLYELHIIGDAAPGRKAAKYKERVRRLACGKNVIFHGELPNADIESVIKDMHVMIHPTICMEVYGLTIAESLSIGRPVLATQCGGAEMQIVDGVNGWLVSPNHVDTLREKILEIINDKDQILAMSNKCHLPHPLLQYTESLLSLYKGLLSNYQ